jgi:hypothetical protein
MKNKKEIEKSKSMEPRYRLVSDDDGHHYVIRVGDEKMFENWVESTLNGVVEYSGPGFEDKRIDNPRCLSFTDPRED